MAAIYDKTPLGHVLIIGGCGFLGHHIVTLLLQSQSPNTSISVLDLRPPKHPLPNITYHTGDITSLPSLVTLFQSIKPTVVIHTASPTLMGGSDALYRKVNVEGTKCVVEACQKSEVKALVYTSSASVVCDNLNDVVNADERWPVIGDDSPQMEYYSLTKAQAESHVLASNRSPSSPSLLTCALRPAGIFGPGDIQIIPNMLTVYWSGKTSFQLGSNENLFDFTYVLNVAHAHILAAKALLSTASLSTVPLSHERVDGEAFFITNSSPVSFWDFARAIWAAAGSKDGTEHVWEISKDTGMAIGAVLEWIMWGLGKTPSLTRKQVKYSCLTRYYDISKARKRLGYEPIVGLGEGIEESVRWFVEEKRKNGDVVKG